MPWILSRELYLILASRPDVFPFISFPDISRLSWLHQSDASQRLVPEWRQGQPLAIFLASKAHVHVAKNSFSLKDSRFFDLKWAPAAAIDHDNLLTGQVSRVRQPGHTNNHVPRQLSRQVVNHFHGAREITTKELTGFWIWNVESESYC